MTALDILVSAVIGGAAWCPAVDAIAGALEAHHGLDSDFAEMWAIASARGDGVVKRETAAKIREAGARPLALRQPHMALSDCASDLVRAGGAEDDAEADAIVYKIIARLVAYVEHES